MQSHCYTKVVIQEGNGSLHEFSAHAGLTDTTVVCEMIAAKTKRKALEEALRNCYIVGHRKKKGKK